MSYCRHAFLLASMAALVAGAPAMAQQLPPLNGSVDAEGRVYGNAMPDPRPQWTGGPVAMPSPVPPPPPGMAMPQGMPVAPVMAAPMAQPGYDQAAFENARQDWLAECRHNHGHGNTVGGGFLGGILGGIIGHEVAGHGDKTLGTVAGAAVGAVAGGAIGHGVDKRGRRDWCEAYLDSHMTTTTTWGPAPAGYTGPTYSYAMQPVTTMVPVMMMQQPVAVQTRPCKENVVTEEWVPEPNARRIIPRRRPVVHDKRIRVVPDKRVPVY